MEIIFQGLKMTNTNDFFFILLKYGNFTIFTRQISKITVRSIQTLPGWVRFDSRNCIPVKKREKRFFHDLIMVKFKDFLEKVLETRHLE